MLFHISRRMRTRSVTCGANLHRALASQESIWVCEGHTARRRPLHTRQRRLIICPRSRGQRYGEGAFPSAASLDRNWACPDYPPRPALQGFIHRDIKPSNFVLSSSVSASTARQGGTALAHAAGSKRQVLVLDFGQSRVYKDEKGEVR